MERSDYGEASTILREHHREVLDELARVLLGTGDADALSGKNVDMIVQAYSHRLWQINTCLSELTRAKARCQPELAARVAEISCSRDSVTALLDDWFNKNAGATIVSVSILDNVDELTCIIVFYPIR